jgi:hypothetical protein
MDSQSLKIKFAKHVKIDLATGCWIWEASCKGGNYGQFGFYSRKSGRKNRNMAAHRASWILYNGNIPDGLFVLHHCDNPRCVNPVHLFLGSQGDNRRDCVAKGRGSTGHKTRNPGEKHYLHKLTDEIVRLIRSDPRGCTAICKDYNVSWSLIWKVKKRWIWKHVD